MKLEVIGTIVAKDLREFSRDRFYVVITIVGLLFYVLIFWVLPDTVDETIELGIVQSGMGQAFEQVADQGVSITAFASDQDLRAAIERGTGGISVGLSFPDDFPRSVAAGSPTTVTVYVTGDVPPEIRSSLSAIVTELGFLAAGRQPLVTAPAETEIVLGLDRAGDQVSLRERMRPLFAFFVLMIEMMALATLIASEVQSRTVTAVLVTPARVTDFLAAKGIAGTLLAFAQAVVLMAAIQSLGNQPLALLLALLLGAIMVTGLGLIAGSIGRDFISIVFWSMLFLIPLLIPAIASMFPGTAAAWIRAIPSFPLVDIIVQITTFDTGFGALGGQFAALAGWCAVAFLAGWWVLRRRVVAL